MREENKTMEFGKYQIKTDSMNVWVEEVYTNKKGETATKRASGYCATYAQAVASFGEHKLKDVDAKNTKEFLEKAAEIEQTIREIANGISA